jgi:hypothetical protein
VQGKIVYPANEPIVYAGKGAMDRADLGAMGYPEQWLVDQQIAIAKDRCGYALEDLGPALE